VTSIFALLVAQSLGEYGGMGGALAEGWNGLRTTVSTLVGSLSTGTWIVIGGAVVLLWLFLRGRG